VSSPIRVLVADDHPVVRQGLRDLLEDAPGIEIVGEAENGEQAVEATKRLRPEVVLMDLVMPGTDGTAATRRILEDRPETRILVLTSYGADDKLFAALKAGAQGFLLKDATGDELVRAIRRTAAGQGALSPAAARRLVEEFARPTGKAALEESLTEREIDVLREIAHGLSNEEIAERLFISPATVRTHIGHILAKLHLSRRTQAVLYALRHGIAGLEDGETPS
jgi:DNA-binding NarL/FixJ family response regulator